ncbi:unnamed protein product [Urochloa humidicola]
MGLGEAAAAGKRKLELCDGGGGGGGGKRPKDDEGERDWARLADDALFCIFRAVLLSGHATSAFAAVCRPWRALAASSKKHLGHAEPPLLLQPTWGEAAMCPAGPRSARRAWRPGPTLPSLRAASPAAAAQPPPPPAALPERFLRTRAVCQSRGYLVTVDESTGRPALTNPLTGEDYLGLFPPLRKQFGDYVAFGMIAAVLGDPSSGRPGSCRVVLYCEDRIFRTCVSGAAAWDTTPWEHPEDPPVQMAVARGRVYALLSRGDLLMFDFMLSFHYCRISLKDAAAPEAFRLESQLSPSMVEHGGHLFVVHCLFLPSESTMPRGIRFSVHRLVRRQWVEQNSLDGLALFVDMAGSALLRARPSQWGGKENHVYVSGQLWDGWKVFPFGDLIEPDQIPMENTIEADWPTPLWTLPCSCY